VNNKTVHSCDYFSRSLFFYSSYRVFDHDFAGWGGLKRFSPVGGAANGTPDGHDENDEKN
jgi:hypothetical protein